MQGSEIEFLAVKCRVALEAMGIDLRIVHDFREAQGLMAELEKASGPALDAGNIILTERNTMWVFAIQYDAPILCVGVRVDDLGQEDAQSFLPRTIEVIFGVKVTGCNYDIFSGRKWGRAAYIGDLKADTVDGLSRSGQNIIQLTMAYTQYQACRLLNADITYCFLRESEHRRGLIYGFRQSDPFVWETDETLYPDGNPGWIMQMPRDKLPSTLAAVSPLLRDGLAKNEKPLDVSEGDTTSRADHRHLNS